MGRKFLTRAGRGGTIGLMVFFLALAIFRLFPIVGHLLTLSEKYYHDTLIQAGRPFSHHVFLEAIRDFTKLDAEASRRRIFAPKPWDELQIKETIFLITYDDRAYSAFSRSIIPRAAMAACLDLLSLGEPRVIGLDVIYGNLNEQEPEGDSALQGAMERAGNVILSSHLESAPIPVEEKGRLKRALSGTDPRFPPPPPNLEGFTENLDLFPVTDIRVAVLEEFADVALACGANDVHKDFDGVVRRLPLWHFTGPLYEGLEPLWGPRALVPTFIGQLFAHFTGNQTRYLEELERLRAEMAAKVETKRGGRIEFFNRPVSLYSERTVSHPNGFQLSFLSPKNDIETGSERETAIFKPEFFHSMDILELFKLPSRAFEIAAFQRDFHDGKSGDLARVAASILQRELKKRFEGRIILISSVAKGDRDAYTIPVSGAPVIPGVELHALGLASLLKGDWITEPNSGIKMGIYLLAGMGSGILFSVVHLEWSIFFLGAGVLFFSSLNLLIFFTGAQVKMPFVVPFAISCLNLGVVEAIRLFFRRF